MSSTKKARNKITIDQTIMPPEADERDEFEKLLDLFHEPSDLPKLVGMDGEPVTLPEDIYRLLRGVLEALTEGIPVSVAADSSTLISTAQAADILGVSRPTMVRILEQDKIPYTTPGKHRRLRLEDVLDYKESVTRGQHGAADAIQDLTYDYLKRKSGDSAA
jgi:excisionase family DNA binding protein